MSWDVITQYVDQIKDIENEIEKNDRAEAAELRSQSNSFSDSNRQLK